MSVTKNGCATGKGLVWIDTGSRTGACNEALCVAQSPVSLIALRPGTMDSHGDVGVCDAWVVAYVADLFNVQAV